MTDTILIHGALGSSIAMEGFCDYLFKKVYACTLNLPGHGGNDCDAGFSIESFSSYLKNHIEKSDLTGCRIFGYSMGGYVALHCAAKYPGLISEIITYGTKFDWNPATAQKEILKLNPDKIEAKLPKFALKLNAQHHPCDWKEVVRKTALLIEKLGSGAALKSDDLAKINIPVTIARGSNDEMVGREESIWAAQSIAGAVFKEIEGAGHIMQNTDFPLFAELLPEKNSISN